MAKQNARTVLNRMNMREALIAPHYTGFMTDMREFAEADESIEESIAARRTKELISAYGYTPGDTLTKPFAFAEGVAIIPVHGTLINRFPCSWGFVTGYNFIRSQVQMAAADDDVQMIVLDVNSCGGEAAGCFELCDDIYALRSEKPIMAVVDSDSYSAAYAIASAASRIIVTPSGGAGSIGVVAMHISYEKMLTENGVKVTFIFAGDHKVDGNPYQDLPDSVKADIKARVDKSRDVFVAQVARNRGLDPKAVLDTEARIYRAEDALSLGLIDAVQPPNQAVQAFFDELSGSNDNQEQLDMGNKANEPGASAKPADEAEVIDTAKLQADARKAERERMSGITGCDEAKSRPVLANHLASSTELSVDEAKAILSAAAPEKQEQATATKPSETATAGKGDKGDKGDSAFHQAMETGKHPNVGADGKVDDMADANTPKATANRILASQALATGRKIEKR